MFYVYALPDPRKDNEFFYIGKGQGRRAKTHLFEFNNKTRSFKQSVIKAIRSSDLEPGITYLHYFEDEDLAFAKEVKLIAFYDRRDQSKGNLTNQTDGGDGIRGYVPVVPRTHSLDTRKRMSQLHTGKDKPWVRLPKSDETRKRMSEALIGKTGRYAGKIPTTEHRRRISQANMEKPCPTKGKIRIYRENGTFYFAFPGNLDV